MTPPNRKQSYKNFWVKIIIIVRDRTLNPTKTKENHLFLENILWAGSNLDENLLFSTHA